MKKFATCFIALLVVVPALGATASRVIPGVTTSDGADARAVGAAQTSARTVARTATTTDIADAPAPRTTVSRVVVTQKSDSDDATTSPRDGATTTATRTAISRSAAASAATSPRDNLDAAINTVGRNARVTAASINNDPSVRRAGLSLRPSTAEVGGRATIAGTNMQTGSNVNDAVRNVQSRAATVTRDSIAEAKELMDQTKELNQSCQEQYNECMDQFCAVVDSNQKRCSCSSNLKQYSKVESAVKDANTQLNEVAQRIRYVGLSADEIRAIMTATEAESALSGTTDNSETRNMLTEIEKMIKDPSASASSYDTSTGFNLDIDLDFSSDSADIFSLDFLGNSASSFSNLRGTELYNAAKKRCNTIIAQCKRAGATADQITGNYDLAIDKDCIAYEQGLNKMNETLVSNVRSANLMLQKARLAVMQNKNQYDAKGCISALETCMLDDMVCGDDYVKCLDPTKKYIDENGNVVLGQDIGKITAFMAEYDNSAITDEALRTMSPSCDKDGDGDGSCVVAYLMKKIGTGQKVTDGGLCRAVLDKCQNYTYSSKTYNPYNDVVLNYIQRAMVNIRAAQHRIISDYASSCMLDVATCYNQQVTQVNAWSSSASVDSIYNVMTGACRNVALTCAYAVFQANRGDTSSACPAEGDDGDTNYQNQCLKSISTMFYDSLLCPDNSFYNADAGDDTSNATGYVKGKCKCAGSYMAYGNACYLTCPAGTEQTEITGKSEFYCKKTTVSN